MVHSRVNEIFARVKERKNVNEISVSNFSFPLVTCIYLIFYPTHINNRE